MPAPKAKKAPTPVAYRCRNGFTNPSQERLDAHVMTGACGCTSYSPVYGGD